MDPRELVELMIVGFGIAIMVIISLFLRGNWRKIGLRLAVVTLVAYGIFYIARPIWIDTQINKKVELIQPYLEQRYPNEEWMISTVPHRKEGYKHLNPYYIGVVFQNEPEVTYYYWVESKNNIYTVATSEKPRYSSEHKHFIKKDE
jgi:hypothetical protein